MGGCADWLNVQTDEVIMGMGGDLVGLYFVYVNDTNVYDEINATYSLFSCENTTFLSLYSQFMKDTFENNVISDVELLCNDVLSPRYLKIKNCNSNNAISMCIDCFDPCNSFSNDYCQSEFLAPCQSVSCWKNSSSLKFYSTKYVPASVYKVPKVKNFTGIPTDSSVEVIIETDSIGFMTCGIFDSSLTSIDSLTAGGFEKIVVESDNGTMTVRFEFNDLVGASIYYIYCRGKSMDGIETPSSTVLDSMNWEISTTCCKSVFVNLVSNKFQVTPFWQIAYDITLQIKPSDALNINLDTTSDTSNSEAFYPLGMQVLSTSTLPISTTIYVNTSNLYHMYGDNTLHHPVRLLLSGSSAFEFDLVYSNNFSAFDIISPEVEPDPPKFYSVQYSNDAAILIVVFDSDTNRADLSSASYFGATEIFDFAGSDKFKCQWINDHTLHLYIDGQHDILHIGKEIILRNSVLKAKCSNSAALPPCDDWAYSYNVRTTIAPAVSPIEPKLQISMPETIGQCTDLSIDLSSSSGSGGQPWTYAISVFSSTENNTTALENYLASLPSQYTVPIAIFASYFARPDVYSFVITLCNFLSTCTTKQTRLLIVNTQIPTVSVVGPVTRTQKRSHELVIHGYGSVANCTGFPSSENIKYEWSMQQNGIHVNLPSTSRQPNVYRLPAYTLSTQFSYTVTLSVSDKLTGQSSSTKVKLLMEKGALKAVIAGGSDRSIRPNEAYTLDASYSYDEDMNPPNDGILYEWSCIQRSPSLSDTCPLFEASSSSTINLIAEPSMVGSVLLVYLKVSDSSFSRYDQTNATIRVVSADKAQISFVSSQTSKYNPSDAIKLTGVISSNFSYSAYWAITNPVIDISSHALTAISADYVRPSSSREMQENYMYLSLMPFSLAERATYSFTLTCVQSVSWSDSTSSATFDVAINGRPLPGMFEAEPTTGFALATEFSMFASNWVDDDLPITFKFYFIEPTSGNALMLSSRSERNTFSSTLPAGPEWNTNRLTVGVEVYDTMNAHAMSEVDLEILVKSADASGGAIDSKTVGEYLANSLASDDVDVVRSSISVVSSTLNANFCGRSGLAETCKRLNREPCKSTPATCGVCFDGFVGVSGDSNTLCIEAESVSAFSRQSSTHFSDINEGRRLEIGQTCNRDDECTGIWEYCDRDVRKCTKEPKYCTNDCALHGSCTYVTTSGRRPFPPGYKCDVDDETCMAVCVCHEGYAGEFCAYTSKEFTDRQLQKYDLLQSLRNLTEMEDRNVESIANWMNTLSSIFTDDQEYTFTGAMETKALTLSLLDLAQQYQLSISSMQLLQSVINEISRFDTISTVANLYELLYAYIVSLSAGMSPGESYNLSTDLISMAITAFPVTAANWKVQLPLTTLQTVNPSLYLNAVELIVHPEKVDIMVDATIALFSIDSSLSPVNRQGIDRSVNGTFFYTGFGMDSNILKVLISSKDLTRLEEAVKYVEVTISNNLEVDYVNTYTYQHDWSFLFFTNCSFGDNTSAFHMCPNTNITIHHQCDGTGGEIYSRCPRYMSQRKPICDIFVPSDVPNSSGCILHSFNSMQTICRCPVEIFLATPIAISPDRRLQIVDDVGANSVLDFIMASQIHTTPTETVTTEFLPLFPYNPNDGIIVYASFFSILAITVFILLFSFYKDDSDIDRIYDITAVKSDEEMLNNVEGLLLKGLPKVLRPITNEVGYFSRILEEMKSYHRWTRPIFGTNHLQGQVLEWLIVVLNIFVMMFVNAAVYSITDNPDSDGQLDCFEFKSSEACLAPKNAFYSGESRCSWVTTSYQSYNGFYCHIRYASRSVRSIIIAAFVTYAFSIPIIYGLKWLLVEFIFKHTRGVSHKEVNKLRSLGMEDMEKVENVSDGYDNTVDRMSIEDRLKSKVVDDLDTLKSKLFQHRMVLYAQAKESDLSNFEREWNLDHETKDKIRFNSLGFPTEESINIDLELINKMTLDMHPRMIGRVDAEGFDAKLMNILFCDALKSRTQKIVLMEKFERDIPRFTTVHGFTRLVALCTFMIVIIMMSVYILYFAMYREHLVESLWFWTCTCWIALDVLLVSPLIVLYAEVFTVRRLSRRTEEIRKVMMKIFTTAHKQHTYTGKSQRSFVEFTPFDGDKHPTVKEREVHLEVDAHRGYFNSVHFMFASARIAHWNSKNSAVAKLVLSLKSQSPSHLIFTYLKNAEKVNCRRGDDVIVYRGWWFRFKQFMRMHHFTITYALGWYNYHVPMYMRRANEELIAVGISYGFLFVNFRIYDIGPFWYIPFYVTFGGLFLIWIALSMPMMTLNMNITNDSQIIEEPSTSIQNTYNPAPENSNTYAFEELLNSLYNSDRSDSDDSANSQITKKKKIESVAFGELSDSSNDDDSIAELYSENEKIDLSLQLIDGVMNDREEKDDNEDQDVPRIDLGVYPVNPGQSEKQFKDEKQLVINSMDERRSMLTQLEEKQQSIKTLLEEKRKSIKDPLTKEQTLSQASEIKTMMRSTKRAKPYSEKKKEDVRKVQIFNDSDSDSDNSEDYLAVVESIQSDEASKVKNSTPTKVKSPTSNPRGFSASEVRFKTIGAVNLRFNETKTNVVNISSRSTSRSMSPRHMRSQKSQHNDKNNQNQERHEDFSKKKVRASNKRQQKVTSMEGRYRRGKLKYAASTMDAFVSAENKEKQVKRGSSSDIEYK